MRVINKRPVNFQFTIEDNDGKLYTFETCTYANGLEHVGLGEREPPDRVWNRARGYGESLSMNVEDSVSIETL